MDWDKLKIFHTVAEASSFTKASTILNLSQSAISRQIQALESDLKVQLFERHARGLVLTENGDYLFKSCLLYTSPSPRDGLLSRMPSSA